MPCTSECNIGYKEDYRAQEVCITVPTSIGRPATRSILSSLAGGSLFKNVLFVDALVSNCLLEVAYIAAICSSQEQIYTMACHMENTSHN